MEGRQGNTRGHRQPHLEPDVPRPGPGHPCQPVYPGDLGTDRGDPRQRGHLVGRPRRSEGHRNRAEARAPLRPAGGSADRGAAPSVLGHAEGAPGSGGRGRPGRRPSPAEIAARFRASVDLQGREDRGSQASPRRGEALHRDRGPRRGAADHRLRARAPL